MQNQPIKRLSIRTTRDSEMLEITSLLTKHVQQMRILNGMLVVYVPHTTAGVCINENADPDVRRDVQMKLAALVPKSETYYRHNEGNSDAHVKSILTGNSATVFIEGGAVLLGKWQGIYLCEYDGPRERSIWLQLISFDPPSSD